MRAHEVFVEVHAETGAVGDRDPAVLGLHALLRQFVPQVLADALAPVGVDVQILLAQRAAREGQEERPPQRQSRMVLLQVDVTANTAEHKALLRRFSLFGPPGIIFFDAQGREVKGLRVIGYQNAGRFLTTLDQVVR